MLEFQAECLLDLVILELDRGIIVVSIRVVLAKNVQGLLVSFLGDEPTWGLGDEEDESELDDGWEGLGEGWDSPGPIRGDSLGAEG
jgi:hypothetical protein